MTEARILRFVKGAALAAAVTLTLGACSLPGSDPAARQAWMETNDPLEPLNRAIFGLNEAADIMLIGPAAHTYELIVPDPVRDSVQSFARNLLTPLTIVNNLLQGDVDGAVRATGRFLTNTVLGAGGIADVATQAGMPYEFEDFGQTLAVWGFEPGPYLFLPILGPSNFRDGIGYALDTAGDPVRITSNAIGKQAFPYAGWTAGGIDRRARLAPGINDLRKNSVDYYAALRSLYAQQRMALIEDNAQTAQPEFPVFDKPGQ